LGKQVHELQSELEKLRTAHKTDSEEIRMLREMRHADLREQRRFKAELEVAARELIDGQERLINERRLSEFNHRVYNLMREMARVDKLSHEEHIKGIVARAKHV
jgi:hypothetical protein